MPQGHWVYDALNGLRADGIYLGERALIYYPQTRAEFAAEVKRMVENLSELLRPQGSVTFPSEPPGPTGSSASGVAAPPAPPGPPAPPQGTYHYYTAQQERWFEQRSAWDLKVLQRLIQEFTPELVGGGADAESLECCVAAASRSAEDERRLLQLLRRSPKLGPILTVMSKHPERDAAEDALPPGLSFYSTGGRANYRPPGK